MYIIYLYFLIVISIFIFERFSSKKIKGLLPFLILIALIIIMGGSTKNPDTKIYEEYIYNNSSFFSKDFGFGLLVQFFKMMNLEYQHLKFFVAVVGMLLINSTANKMLKETKYLYLLYFLNPFFMDVVQVRNFLAMSIFIYAIPYLISNKKIDLLKYVFLVLIAASFQKVAIIYIIIAFIKNYDDKKHISINKLLKTIILISILVFSSKGMLVELINFLQKNIASKLDGLEEQLVITTNYGWLINWGIQFINFCFISLIYKNSKNETDEWISKKNYNVKKYIHIMYNINLYLFCFIPLYIITPNFTRVMRNCFILNDIAILAYIQYSVLNKVEVFNNKFITKKILYYVFFAYVLLTAYIQFIYSNHGLYWELIIMNILNNNCLWQYIIL